MSRPEDPSETADASPQEPAETRDEVRGSKAASLLDAEVEAPINAAVQDPDFDERERTEGG